MSETHFAIPQQISIFGLEFFCLCVLYIQAGLCVARHLIALSVPEKDSFEIVCIIDFQFGDD
jgi:hypothetical protein